MKLLDLLRRPNKWYDQIKEPHRLLGMVGLYFVLVFSFGFTRGWLLFCFVGLYRILYHLDASVSNLRRPDFKIDKLGKPKGQWDQ